MSRENPDDKKVMRSGPGDDEQQDDNDQQDDNQNDDDNQSGDDDNQQPQFATRAELEKFQQKQDQIFSMLQSLTKQPAQQTQQPNGAAQPNKKGEIGGMSAEDFEALFWESPAEAFRLYEQSLVTKVRGEQAKVTSQQQFWTDFYAKHNDLREDDDLVKLTLNAHIGTLADMPVAEASEKLADLTRQRILKYSGGEKRGQNGNGNKRVFTEGSEHRIPKTEKKEPEAPRTLGELIKARKAARRGGGKAMAS